LYLKLQRQCLGQNKKVRVDGSCDLWRFIGYYNKVLNFQNKACGLKTKTRKISIITSCFMFFVFQSIKQSIPSLQTKPHGQNKP
jgi:hypothetical protein